MKTDRLDRLNRWLTLVANVGVLAGLVLIAVEIRQNTSASEAASREAMSVSTIGFLLQMSSDSEKVTFWRRALAEPASLEVDERFRRDMVAYAVAESWEMAYAQWQRGVLSDADWEKWDRIILTYMTAPGFREFWEQSSPNLGKSFRAYVNGLKGDATPLFPAIQP